MPARLTPKEVRTRLRKRHIRLLDRYVSVNRKYHFKCLKCSHVWLVGATDVISGHNGCPACSRHRSLLSLAKAAKGPHLSRRLDAEEVAKRLRKRGIKLLDKYRGTGHKYHFKCLANPSHTWRAEALRFISDGKGCPECSKEKRIERIVAVAKARMITAKEVRRVLRKKHIKLLNRFESTQDKYSFKCRVCSRTWVALAWSVLWYSGCPKCAIERFRKIRHERAWAHRLSQKEVKNRLRKKRIRILGKYLRATDRYRFKCLQCRYIWKIEANSVINGDTGCPKCSGSLPLTFAEIKRRIRKCNPDVIINRASDESIKEYKFRCKECGNCWVDWWYKFVCRKCNPHRFGVSENKARKTLERITGWKFPKTTQSTLPWLKGRSKGNGLHLDGYNKRHRIGFEYQGEQRYKKHRNFALYLYKGDKKKLIKQKRNDERKRVLCYKHRVLLICIPYWKQDVKGFIKLKLRKAGFDF